MDATLEEVRPKNGTWSIGFGLLQVCLIAPAVFWIFSDWQLVPGVAVALLAVAAAFMSIHPEMNRTHKVVWMLLIAVYLVHEYRAIRKDRRENSESQTEQRRAFETVANKLSSSITQAQQQYDSTVAHVDGVLKTTQGLASVTRKNLEIVTGGDTFAILLPHISSTSANDKLNADLNGFIVPGSEVRFNFGVHSMGDAPLTGLTLNISRIVRVPSPGNPGYDSFGGLEHPIVQLGTLAPHDILPLSEYFLPVLQPNQMDHYFIFISAQNGTVHEDLYFRRSKDGRNWAYKYELHRWKPAKENDDGTIRLGKLLKKSDWIEPPN